MIDYFFQFTSQNTAISTAAGTTYYNANVGQWNPDTVEPGIQCWMHSQDISNTANGVTTTTHQYLTGWFGCISIPNVDPVLLSQPSLQIAINRERAAAGLPAIIVSNISNNSLLQDLRFQPVFAGSNYPFGNLI